MKPVVFSSKKLTFFVKFFLEKNLVLNVALSEIDLFLSSTLTSTEVVGLILVIEGREVLLVLTR